MPPHPPSNIEIEEVNNTFADLIDILKNVIAIVLIVLVIRGFIFAPFSIEGDSMNHSYHHREFVFVNKFSYLDFETHFSDWKKENSNLITKTLGNILSKIPLHIGDPKRGDVVVLNPHLENRQKLYLKRVIGLPEDIIKIEGGKVFIKTKDSSDFVEINEPYLSLSNKNHTETFDEFTGKEMQIPKGHYWVMGDNRINSADSRNCFHSCVLPNSSPFLKRENIIGKISMSLGYFDLWNHDSNGKINGFGSFSWQIKPRFFSTPSSAEYPELNPSHESR